MAEFGWFYFMLDIYKINRKIRKSRKIAFSNMMFFVFAALCLMAPQGMATDSSSGAGWFNWPNPSKWFYIANVYRYFVWLSIQFRIHAYWKYGYWKHIWFQNETKGLRWNIYTNRIQQNCVVTQFDFFFKIWLNFFL